MPNIKSLVAMSALLSNAKGYSDPGSKNTNHLRSPKFSTNSKTQINHTLASNHSHTRNLQDSSSTEALRLFYTKIDTRCDDCPKIITSDSGLLVTFTNDCNEQLRTSSLDDVVFIKYGPNGDKEWSKQIGNSDSCYTIYDIVESEDYFGFVGSVEKNCLNCQSDTYGWIGQLSKSGDYLASQRLFQLDSEYEGGEQTTYLKSVGALADGSMVYSGYTSFDCYYTGAFLGLVNSDLETQWNREVDTVNFDFVGLKDGNFIAQEIGTTHPRLTKFNAVDGSKIWTRNYHSRAELFSSIEATADGGTISAAYDHAYDTYMSVWKHKSDGTLEWEQINHGTYAVAYYATEMTNGNFLVIGKTKEYTNDGSFELFIAKLANNGTLVQLTTYDTLTVGKLIHVEDNGKITMVIQDTNGDTVFTRVDADTNFNGCSDLNHPYTNQYLIDTRVVTSVSSSTSSSSLYSRVEFSNIDITSPIESSDASTSETQFCKDTTTESITMTPTTTSTTPEPITTTQKPTTKSTSSEPSTTTTETTSPELTIPTTKPNTTPPTTSATPESSTSTQKSSTTTTITTAITPEPITTTQKPTTRSTSSEPSTTTTETTSPELTIPTTKPNTTPPTTSTTPESSTSTQKSSTTTTITTAITPEPITTTQKPTTRSTSSEPSITTTETTSPELTIPTTKPNTTPPTTSTTPESSTSTQKPSTAVEQPNMPTTSTTKKPTTTFTIPEPTTASTTLATIAAHTSTNPFFNSPEEHTVVTDFDSMKETTQTTPLRQDVTRDSFLESTLLVITLSSVGASVGILMIGVIVTVVLVKKHTNKLIAHTTRPNIRAITYEEYETEYEAELLGLRIGNDVVVTDSEEHIDPRVLIADRSWDDEVTPPSSPRHSVRLLVQERLSPYGSDSQAIVALKRRSSINPSSVANRVATKAEAQSVIARSAMKALQQIRLNNRRRVQQSKNNLRIHKASTFGIDFSLEESLNRN